MDFLALSILTYMHMIMNMHMYMHICIWKTLSVKIFVSCYTCQRLPNPKATHLNERIWYRVHLKDTAVHCTNTQTFQSQICKIWNWYLLFAETLFFQPQICKIVNTLCWNTCLGVHTCGCSATTDCPGHDAVICHYHTTSNIIIVFAHYHDNSHQCCVHHLVLLFKLHRPRP